MSPVAMIPPALPRPGIARALVVGLLIFAVGFGGGWWARSPAPDPVVRQAAAQVDTVARARQSAVLQAEGAAAADGHATAAADTLRRQVVVLGDSSLRIQQTPVAGVQLVIVPPLVVARIESLEAEVTAKALRVEALEQLVQADSAVIDRQGAQITLLEARQRPRCGARCGAIAGVVATIGASALLGGLR